MTNRTYRIGQIVPSSNTTMETEIPQMLRDRESVAPQRFTFHSSRMRMMRVSKEELAAMNRDGVRCAAELADARVDVMSTACLVAIMAMGHGYHRKVEEAKNSKGTHTFSHHLRNCVRPHFSPASSRVRAPSSRAASARAWIFPALPD